MYQQQEMQQYYPYEIDSVDDEMMINLYENPNQREALTLIPGTNTYVNSVYIVVSLADT